jgi:DNA-binding beta-propeller fold protein YncE
MRRFIKRLTPFIIAVCFLAAFAGSPESAHAISASFLYDLSDFTGPLRYGGASVFVDRERNEAYVLSESIVHVFDDNGMEIYQFRTGDTVGSVVALAVDRDGTIFALAYKEVLYASAHVIVRCNFRGEPVGHIALKGLSPDYSGFMPVYMGLHEGRFYLADSMNMRIVIADMNGEVQKSYDLIPLLDLKEGDRGDTQMGGFSVDGSGNMLFTVPVLFSAFVLSPEGTLRSFGSPGSLPGKFSIVSDIIRDNRGNILVADKLKSVVNVFDKDFKFLLEFGGRGNAPGNIVVPGRLAIDSNDKLFVTQASNRGVSVFRLQYN